jgi:hypothetical protein
MLLTHIAFNGEQIPVPVAVPASPPDEGRRLFDEPRMSTVAVSEAFLLQDRGAGAPRATLGPSRQEDRGQIEPVAGEASAGSAAQGSPSCRGRRQ